MNNYSENRDYNNYHRHRYNYYNSDLDSDSDDYYDKQSYLNRKTDYAKKQSIKQWILGGKKNILPPASLDTLIKSVEDSMNTSINNKITNNKVKISCNGTKLGIKCENIPASKCIESMCKLCCKNIDCKQHNKK
jgi:hypothetical protein